MKETNLVQKIRLECTGAILFRQNTGKLQDKNGRWVEFGLCVGSSDIIGWHKETGRFVAIEVKIPGKTPTDTQLNFIKQVKKAGGLAGVAYSVEDAQKIIDGG